MADKKHTIVLVQPTQNRQSRTFFEHETISAAMNGVCNMFEARLKELYPKIKNITYDVEDLYNYIDALADCSALVYMPEIGAYVPHNRMWIKQKAFAHLSNQAGKN
uniref:Enhancer of rudimentary homolog n=1 Tax=Mantoniella antarctica TaxID=81844 RepID=A0A7S0SX96_9CHLO|mmetsp:Transcript_32120/g.51453  ORF Transcript_32120/g.51453 Transcript_32120/m.51453 type:complete len:106 (+) Transcript_32120:156-473(+)|eukprot:CAMPEP_0198683038 /NCGR_PEP_ID=MMETSP1468-20131203/9905_1 /TAXON_ID=1461545 /ORGANISM="Mantoniella sp, Strain CCMP1436" /LENGTH=105 /DNA_ID=CAMNT_0044426657 /DNA_START=127 /DNA_END=444 /DNA_ORIENTATION=-